MSFVDWFLSIQQANKLRTGYPIDHRDRYGQFRKATVIEKSDTKLKIHYNDLSDRWDEWCDYNEELYRFATVGTISQRLSHRFNINMDVGDYININPPFKQTQCGWKTCKILKKHDTSGQFQVSYEHQNKRYTYWFHTDNTKEVEWFDIKSDIMTQLTTFGYSTEDIIFALNKAVNRSDINSIHAIIQQREQQRNKPNHDNKEQRRESEIIVIGAKKEEKKDEIDAPYEPQLKDMKEFKRFKIYIAIDFGTDGVGLSYLIGDVVYIHTEWASVKVKTSVKIKTVILLDEYYKQLSFGEDAKFQYMLNPKQKDKWLLFERFKMSLYEDEKDNDYFNEDDHKESNRVIRDTLIASNGKEVPAGIVFVAAFKYFQTLAEKYLKKKKFKHMHPIKRGDIQWIITVPAIWNDDAKHKMKQWTIDAGLVDPNVQNQCKIVYEPDCAALSIHKRIHLLYQEMQTSNNNEHNNDSDEDEDAPGHDMIANTNNMHFSDGDKYILVDAGGGTVDIACHEMLGHIDDFSVKEIHHPSGGKWGSVYIDDQFIKLLKDLFSEEWVNQFNEQHPQKFLLLTHNFQRSKISFFSQQSTVRIHNVEMELDFLGFMADKIEELEDDLDIEDFVKERKVFGRSNVVSLSDGYLEIDVTAWEVMFNHVINPTVQHIETLLDKPKLKNKVSYLALVGGLSTSKYFQWRMEDTFGKTSKYKMTLITPERPILSVVDGAANFGITRNYIKARILRYTYGQSLSYSVQRAISEGISLEYINKHRYYDEIEKMLKVGGCFKVIARKNEEIETGDIRKSYSRKDRTMDKTSSKKILYSYLELPKVKTDGKVIGNIITQFDEDDELHIGMTLEFHFYDTIIKVISYKNNAPENRQTHYITNYA